MSGTLAIWYEPIPTSDSEALVGTSDHHNDSPTLELHFNLWRDLVSHADFFDIGFKFCDTDRLNRFFLFIPQAFALQQISDLSPLLKHSSSLNAVFNDVLTIENRDDQSFETSIRGETFTRIHQVDILQDLSVEPVDIDASQVGTIVTFGRSLCERIRGKSSKSHYIRLRLTLNERSRHLFSSEVLPGDWWLLSSFYPMELTEFRLNERRSIPPSISQWFEDGRLKIIRVQYFLIRDLRYELVVQHRDFRKIRMLEADLWRHYLRGRPPESDEDLRELPRAKEDRLVIYHWREKAEEPDESIEDFNAFAKFRSPRTNLLIYAIAIVSLGALGSATHAAVVEATRLWLAASTPPEAAVLAAAVILFLAVVVIGLLAYALSRPQRRRFGQWIRRVFSRIRRRL